MKKLIVLYALGIISYSCAYHPLPISFSISETKVVSEIPPKDQDFAFIIPGNIRTYIYNTESDYYKDYQRSYFAITCKKGGWDCMRHYEILANGCIPYFINIDKCPPCCMHLLPKELIKQAMRLEGVSYGKIDHTKFDKKKYYEILHKLLEHTKQYLTTRSMATYFLQKIRYTGNGPILFLGTNDAEDYLKLCLLIGLKEIYNEKIVDYPKIPYIYTNYAGDTKKLYGKGFTYTKIIEDIPVNRENIEQRIKNKEFDLIIYGYVHHGCPFYDLVQRTYPADKIAYICGQDEHPCPFKELPNFFLREYY